MKKKSTTPQFVNVTKSGRISLIIKGHMKPSMWFIFDGVINSPQTYRHLDWASINYKINKTVMEEIFQKNFALIHLMSDSKMLLSRSQALVFWYWANQNHKDNTPDLNVLVMQLHQRLTSMS